MRFLAFFTLFVIGAVVGMAVIPLLPGGAQEWISEFHEGINSVREPDTVDNQVSRPTSTPSATTLSQPTPTPRPTHVPGFTPTPYPTPTHGPTPTPGPTFTPAPTLTQGPTPTPTRMPLPTPTFTPGPTPAPTSTPLPTPTPTPIPPPDLRHYEYKVYMLELINEEREKAGVPPVTMGNNIAAQLHAENAIANCFSSHWGVDGLKPYMRYSLAGGYQSNGENGSGRDYCIKASDGYLGLRGIRSEIQETMESLMNSSGHRRNILHRWHKKVNIGLAWDSYNFSAYQHFEGGYVEFDELPEIANDVLSFSGHAINELRFSDKSELGLQLYYDPPPHPLTRGQVSRTYCYDTGLQIAGFRYPLTGNYYWSSDQFSTTHTPCPDPYDVSPNAAPPQSHDEAHEFWRRAYSASQSMVAQPITVPWITASVWTASGTNFSVAVNIGGLLSKYGPGVYTILLWGEIGGEDVVIAEYSIFHEVAPPDTYNPDQWE